MKCCKCENILQKAEEDFILKSDNKTFIFENTPTYICKNCYEKFYEDGDILKIENIVEKAKDLPIKILIADFLKIK